MSCYLNVDFVFVLKLLNELDIARSFMCNVDVCSYSVTLFGKICLDLSNTMLFNICRIRCCLNLSNTMLFNICRIRCCLICVEYDAV